MAGPFYEQVRLRSLDRVFEAVVGQDRDDVTEFLLRKYVFPARAARRNQDNPGPFRYVDARSFANLPGGAADHVFVEVTVWEHDLAQVFDNGFVVGEPD